MEGAWVSEVERYERRRRLRLVGWGAGMLLLVGLVVGLARNPDHLSGALSADTASSVGSAVWTAWMGTIFNPWYIGLVIVLLVLERFFAAEQTAGTFTVGGANDLLWLVAYPLTSVTLVSLWLGALGVIYLEDLGGVVMDLPEAIGLPAAVVVTFLVGDFLNWFTHYVRHKVPTFWYFHAVHHSQPQMGVLTDFRVHFMEAIIASTLVFVPARLLGLDGSAALLLAISTLYFTAFTHANLRTNLGPLRYLLVTPQFHRVHHGYAPEHIDTNFATALSVWDRIFGTAYTADEDEYCRTGIHDERFPLTREATVGEVCRSYIHQNVYPFQQCLEDIRTFELGRGRPQPAKEPIR